MPVGVDVFPGWGGPVIGWVCGCANRLFWGGACVHASRVVAEGVVAVVTPQASCFACLLDACFAVVNQEGRGIIPQ